MDLLGFAATVLLIEVTPGPNMAWLAMIGGVEGRRAGFAAVAGTAIGLTLNGLLAAAGLALLLSTTPWLWEALRLAGAAMMLWLAWEAWRGRPSAAIAGGPAETATARGYLLRGAAVNLLNPKAFIFYIVVAPAFLGGQAPDFATAATLTAISVTIATAIHFGIVSMGGAAHGWLSQPQRTRAARKLLAVGMVGVALWFLFSTRG